MPSPVADVFTSPNLLTPSDTAKPLPPIIRCAESGNAPKTLVNNDDEDSAAALEAVRARLRQRRPSEDVVSKTDSAAPSKHVKRRSMSVGEADLLKAMAEASTTTPLPIPPQRSVSQPIQPKSSVGKTSWEKTLADFKGELSQLDPFSGSSLELVDPTLNSTEDPAKDPGATIKAPSLPRTPTLQLQTAYLEDHSNKTSPVSPRSQVVEAPIVPPRTSSLRFVEI